MIFFWSIGERGLAFFFLKLRKGGCSISWPGIGILWFFKLKRYLTEPKGKHDSKIDRARQLSYQSIYSIREEDKIT